MQSAFSNALSEATAKHIRLSPTRHETLCWLVLLILRHGTICLWRLAAHVATPAQTDSVRRRFYRFFQHVRFDDGAVARLMAQMLGLSGKPLVLAIDRTNWDFGRTTINILMLSAMWNGVGVPLVWTLLPKAGNSHTRERTELLDRLRAIFPDVKVASLTGDREFIGEAWMTYLARQKIPFVLRLRENQHVTRDGYATWPLVRIAQGLKRGETMILKGWCRLGPIPREEAPRLRIVLMRLKSGELLALACQGRPRRALALYRQRWTIETLFGNLKTRGFDIEATHITNPEKLSTLIALLALATALAAKTGVAANAVKPIPVKNHGRKAVSLFALGIAALRKILAAAQSRQIIAFLRSLLAPKIPLKPLQRLAFQ